MFLIRVTPFIYYNIDTVNIRRIKWSGLYFGSSLSRFLPSETNKLATMANSLLSNKCLLKTNQPLLRMDKETMNVGRIKPCFLSFALGLSRFLRSRKDQQASIANPSLANTRLLEVNEPFLRMDQRLLRKTETFLRVTKALLSETMPLLRKIKPLLGKTEPLLGKTEPLLRINEPLLRMNEPFRRMNEPPKVVLSKGSNSAINRFSDINVSSYQNCVKESAGPVRVVEKFGKPRPPRPILKSHNLGNKVRRDREPSRLPLKSVLRRLRRKRLRKHLQKRLRSITPMSSLLYDLLINYKFWHVHFVHRSDSFFSTWFCKPLEQSSRLRKLGYGCSDLMSHDKLRIPNVDARKYSVPVGKVMTPSDVCLQKIPNQCGTFLNSRYCLSVKKILLSGDVEMNPGPLPRECGQFTTSAMRVLETRLHPHGLRPHEH